MQYEGQLRGVARGGRGAGGQLPPFSGKSKNLFTFSGRLFQPLSVSRTKLDRIFKRHKCTGRESAINMQFN